MKLDFVSAQKAFYPVTTLCRVLQVSRSAYYGARIAAIHRSSRATYGSPRIHAQLREENTRVSRKRVARRRPPGTPCECRAAPSSI